MILRRMAKLDIFSLLGQRSFQKWNSSFTLFYIQTSHISVLSANEISSTSYMFLKSPLSDYRISFIRITGLPLCSIRVTFFQNILHTILNFSDVRDVFLQLKSYTGVFDFHFYMINVRRSVIQVKIINKHRILYESKPSCLITRIIFIIRAI